MWVVPVKTTVPGAGSGGPPSAEGQASGIVLVTVEVNVAEAGPPPPVWEHPLNVSAVAPVTVSGLTDVCGFLSWPRPGVRCELPFTEVHFPITVAALALPVPMNGAATRAATMRTAYRRTIA